MVYELLKAGFDKRSPELIYWGKERLKYSN